VTSRRDHKVIRSHVQLNI